MNVCKYIKVKRAVLGKSVCAPCSLNPFSMDKDIKVTEREKNGDGRFVQDRIYAQW